MNLQLTTYNSKLILILMFICGLFDIVNYGLLFGQDDYLNVKGNTKAETITFAGNLTAYPVAPLEGEVFYNAQEKLPKYFDGAAWRKFGGPKTVATKIVSAYNSVGATRDGTNACLGDGTTCNNPKADYTCDGTDDQVKINRAINSLPIDPNGVSYGVVYLLEGTYNISTALEDGDLPASGETVAGIIPHSNTAIIGTGRGTVLKVVASANFNVINASSVNRIFISQLMIDGNRTSVTGLNHGIYFSSVTFSKIDKVWVENMSSGSGMGFGIFLESSSNNTISNSHVRNNGSNGLNLVGSSNNIITNNNLVSNGASGIQFRGGWLEDCLNNIVSGNNVQDNSVFGISIALYPSQPTNAIITNNNVQNNSQGGISIRGFASTVVSGIIVSGNNVQISNNGAGIALESTASSTISNNNVLNNRYQGIYLSSSSTNTITGNVIYDNGGSGAYDGIKLVGSDSNIISSNRLYDSAGTGYGINISANTCNNNYLVSNLIDGTTGTSATGYYNPLALPPYDHRIQDLGTGTKYTDKAKMTLERQAVVIVPGNGIIPVGPASYVSVVSNGGAVTANTTTPIAAGKAAGDILILEGTDDTNTVEVPDSDTDNVNLMLTGGEDGHVLGRNDILKLIWNGSRWLETAYSDKQPLPPPP